MYLYLSYSIIKSLSIIIKPIYLIILTSHTIHLLSFTLYLFYHNSSYHGAKVPNILCRIFSTFHTPRRSTPQRYPYAPSTICRPPASGIPPNSLKGVSIAHYNHHRP